MAVTVSDNGDGTMTAVVEYANEEGTAPTFTNVVNHGDLLFGKKVKDFAAGNKETEFTFTFSLKDADGNALTEEHDYWIYTATSVPDENTEKTGTVTDGSTVTLKDGEFCLVKGLHTDTQYVVTEEETENFKLISVKDAAGNEYADLQATGSIGANETSEATFENEDVTPMTLTVTKVVEGYDPKLEYSPFKFSLTLKDSNKKELKGIEFKYAIEKAGPGNRRETGTIMSGGTFELNHGDVFTLGGLPKGTTFTVTEKRTQGYVAGVKIVNADGEEVENASKAPKAEGSLTHEQGDLTVTVTNAPGGRIPGVGGMGTTLYYVLGGLLTLAAGAVLLTKGRRKKKETA